jgi:beta-hydroxyacyl-ACP dehydratase FabZ
MDSQEKSQLPTPNSQLTDSSLSFEEVRKLVPQTYPFLMLDRVLELEPGKRIVAVKNVSGNEGFFQGHFPEFAIMPAALILEALAQATIVLQRKSAPPGAATDDRFIYLFGSVSAKMKRPVFPGDVLKLEVKLIKSFGEGGAAEGLASVDGQTCVQADMYYSRTKLEDLMRRR